MSVKSHKTISLPIGVLADMRKSGIDVSEWIAEQWLDNKYAVESIDEKINWYKEQIEVLEKKKLENIDFQKKIIKSKDKFELKMLESLKNQLERVEPDLTKEELAYKCFVNNYNNKYGTTITSRMAKAKLENYLEHKG